MDKLKIYVACHKPGSVRQDDIYTPIHVGRAISKYKEEMADMIGDDTGDNISEKNPQYCELTAQYWAWKNLHNVEYVGFCHYRRFFDIKTEDIEMMLRGKDAIVIEMLLDHPLWREIPHFITVEDMTIMLMVLKKKYPEYEETLLKYLNGYTLYAKNMLICKKELFDQYAEWLFDVLFECEKYIKPSPYTRGRRALAYMGEYLLPVYIMHHECKIRCARYTDGKGHAKPYYGLKHRIAYNMIHWLIIRHKKSRLEDLYLQEVLVGFKNDGIIIC
jgi:hypothetical protein